MWVVCERQGAVCLVCFGVTVIRETFSTVLRPHRAFTAKADLFRFYFRTADGSTRQPTADSDTACPNSCRRPSLELSSKHTDNPVERIDDPASWGGRIPDTPATTPHHTYLYPSPSTRPTASGRIRSSTVWMWSPIVSTSSPLRQPNQSATVRMVVM